MLVAWGTWLCPHGQAGGAGRGRFMRGMKTGPGRLRHAASGIGYECDWLNDRSRAVTTRNGHGKYVRWGPWRLRDGHSERRWRVTDPIEPLYYIISYSSVAIV